LLLEKTARPELARALWVAREFGRRLGGNVLFRIRE